MGNNMEMGKIYKQILSDMDLYFKPTEKTNSGVTGLLYTVYFGQKLAGKNPKKYSVQNVDMKLWSDAKMIPKPVSNKLSENSLRLMIRRAIGEILSDDEEEECESCDKEIEETSSVGGQGGGDGYQTPAAFVGKGGKDRKNNWHKNVTNKLGYETVWDEEDATTLEGEDIRTNWVGKKSEKDLNEVKWNEDETAGWEHVLSKGKNLASNSKNRAMKELPNLFKQNLVTWNAMSNAVMLNNNGKDYLKKNKTLKEATQTNAQSYMRKDKKLNEAKLFLPKEVDAIKKTKYGKIAFKKESIDYDEWRNTRVQAKNIFRMLKQKYNNKIPDMKKGLEDIFKMNKTKPDQKEVMWQEFNKYFKINESVYDYNTKHLIKKVYDENILNEANGHEIILQWKGLHGNEAKIGKFLVSPKTYEDLDDLFGNEISFDLYDDKVSGTQTTFAKVVDAIKKTKYGKTAFKKESIGEGMQFKTISLKDENTNLEEAETFNGYTVQINPEIDDLSVGSKLVYKNKIRTVKKNDGERVYFDGGSVNWLDMKKIKKVYEELKPTIQQMIDTPTEAVMEGMQFKTISLKDENGFKEAEKLQKQGWVVRSVGLFTVQLSKGKSDKFRQRENIKETVRNLIKEIRNEKLFFLTLGGAPTLWSAYSPGSGVTKPIKNMKSYFTDKSSDSHFDFIVKKILEWAKSNTPIKKNKTNTKMVYKVPVYDYDQINYATQNQSQMDIWGGNVKPKKYYYVLIVSEQGYHIVNVFEKSNEAMSWLREEILKEAIDEIVKIYINNDPYWLRKTGDTTHFHMAPSEKGILAGGEVFHIGQHKDELYYDDIVKWLKGQADINGKKYKKFSRQRENIKEIAVPTDIHNEIMQSIKMGFNKLATGMISPKRKGVMLINKKYEVRGTYDLALKQYIQSLIDKQKNEIKEEVSQQAKDDVTTLLKSYDGKEVPDDKVHTIADKHSISPHDLESYIYSLASAHVTMAENINEGRRGQYQIYRDDDSLTAQQKIGESIKRMRKNLKELTKEVALNLRLKTESGVESDNYWKRTRKDLQTISEHLFNLQEKIRRF